MSGVGLGNGDVLESLDIPEAVAIKLSSMLSCCLDLNKSLFVMKLPGFLKQLERKNTIE